MLAIQRLNPGAFIDGNINLLRRGQVLRVPTRDDITEVSRNQAVTEVAYQNSRWSDNDDTPVTGAQLEGAKRGSVERVETRGLEGRVKLAAPVERDESDVGQGGGALDGSSEVMESELTTALEELDKSRRENTELSSRLSELQEQIQTMERLLSVSNEQLRALELAAQQPAEAVETAVVSEEIAPAEVMKPTKVTAEPVSKPGPSQTVVRSAPKSKGLFDHVMDNLLLIGGGLLAIIAAIALLLRRRQDEQDEELDELEEQALAEAELAEASAEESLEAVTPDAEGDEELPLDLDEVAGAEA